MLRSLTLCGVFLQTSFQKLRDTVRRIVFTKCAQGDDFRTFLGRFVACLPQAEILTGLSLGRSVG